MNDYEIEHIRTLRQLLPECTVVLRKSGSFPLDSPCRIVLAGNGARHTVKGGTGSGEVNSRYFVTAEEGLKNAGFDLVSSFWMDEYDKIYSAAKKRFTRNSVRNLMKNPAGIMEAMGTIMPEPEYCLHLPENADAAVYVLSRISGEGTDKKAIKGDFFLTDTERRDILLLAEKYAKFILVINSGAPVDLSGLESVKDILVLSQLGVDTGNALADILLGKANPSGRLTTSWSSYEDYQQIGNFDDPDDTEYKEGIYVGYRYFDSVGRKALFPFGYGLSYTTFKMGQVNVSAIGELVSVSANVKNTGRRPGRQVLQLYVSCPDGKLDKPFQALAAFAKTSELSPRQSETIEMSFRLSDLASYDEKQACYVLEKGNYVIRLGTSSADTSVVSVIGLDADVKTKKVKNLLGTPGFADWHPVRVTKSVREPDLLIRAEEIPCAEIDYGREYEILPEAENLSAEELATMNVGSLYSGGLIQSVIGEASAQVAGAAGESYNGIVMADGPAGLRLSKQYVQTAKGAKAIGLTVPESVTATLPESVLKLAGKISEMSTAGKDRILEQYTTAIPIGTAIAQSWNIQLAETCGDIVGEEMERFQVDLWLAPALNIHRNVLCGRNFEYFSEDPLISGKMAAAITRGVQRHSGCGVTIKHFAANNQEFRRFSSNSKVSERAMREIYLRGFEIAVREGHPASLMTSYNLINGEHASQLRPLLNDLLRCEWGFDGVIMTDWLVSQDLVTKGTKYRPPEAWKIAAAGGDIVMPGSPADKENVLSALKDGRLDRKQLEINATRLLKIKKLS